MDNPPRKSAFGQGLNVDRARPHIFHADYWPLKVLLRAVDQFAAQNDAALRGKKCLDLGAGDSPYADLLRQRGVEILAADIDPTDPGVLPIDKATGRVPLDDQSVDAVLSTQVLEHVPDPQLYLKEAHRVLKSGGVFFCSTHGSFPLHRHPTDFRRWTVDGLRYELEQAGFTVDAMLPQIGMLAASTYMRSRMLGGLTRRIPLTGWLRPIIYCFFNVRMAVEEWITPKSVMEIQPVMLFASARRV